jgi:Cu/Ag efflux pump CusA
LRLDTCYSYLISSTSTPYLLISLPPYFPVSYFYFLSLFISNPMFNRLVKYFLENRLVTFIFLMAFVGFGIVYTPFNWHTGIIPRDPIPVDAIPDIGDNQQIVATEWMGRSPKDIQDQVTFPLTSALLGIPGVKTVRSTSMFGMSFIYIIFNDDVDFYWSRSRILEKLNSLPTGTLPQGVAPTLGPDATALGQIYWYTLEGRDPKTGKPNGGWSPQELRTLQDFYVKYGLSAAEGVSEVASVGGFVKEYQVDINPEALKAFGVSVMDVMNAVRKSNLDIGAETIELNNVEYIVRGLGYVKNLDDLESSVVAVRNNVPVRIKDVAQTSFGPATRRGGLDKGGSEAVGAVVVARYGANPMTVIGNLKEKIKELEAGLPQKTLADGSISKVTIVPFYDRTGLIKETIGTLETALSHEILISIIVIIVLVLNLRASLIVAGLLPIGVLMTFILMHLFGVDANIVALSGIAIAIGVMVDIGIVDLENILRHLEMPENHGIRGKQLMAVIYQATTEVRDAVVTSIATTIVSFLPVFAMEAAEGKLFHPLAFTKTFALISAFVLGIVVLPTLVHVLFDVRINGKRIRKAMNYLLIAASITFVAVWQTWPALTLAAIGANNLLAHRWDDTKKEFPNYINIGITVLVATYYLSIEWLPLGAHNGTLPNFLFVAAIVSTILTGLMLMVHFYEPILRWGLAHKAKFLALPAVTLLLGVLVWQGTDALLGPIAAGLQQMGWKQFKETTLWQSAVHTFPGTGKEFMPSLNEGSFLLMPTSMPHSSIEKNLGYIETLDKRLAAIPEVEVAVGKWGRVNSALDPAPVQMFENTINYRPEYILDEDGHRQRFMVDGNGYFVLDIDKIRHAAEINGNIIRTDSVRKAVDATSLEVDTTSHTVARNCLMVAHIYFDVAHNCFGVAPNCFDVAHNCFKVAPNILMVDPNIFKAASICFEAGANCSMVKSVCLGYFAICNEYSAICKEYISNCKAINGRSSAYFANRSDVSAVGKKVASTYLEVAPTYLEVDGKREVVAAIDQVVYDKENNQFRVSINHKWIIVKPVAPNTTSGFNLYQYISANVGDFLTKDNHGEYFRQWRKHIKKPDDIWNEIVKVTQIPGLTSAPKLQPIETRLVMLSTGMRAPMGLKVFGPDLESIEKAGLAFEKALKTVPSINPSSVFYDRAVGAPYIEITLNREAMARYGMTVSDVQEILQVAVGGMALGNTVEGRERFPMRVRYARELRDNPDDLKRILVSTATGTQVPLGEIADIGYTRGAQMIRSENTFLVGYVIFDKLEGKAEVDVVDEASATLSTKLAKGVLTLPAGVSYKFAGNYEQQLRATKRLAVVIPISLLVILLLLYFQFKTITASLIHFSGVFVAFAGGFMMLWLYGQGWFLDFTVAGVNLRDMFQIHPINLSVAVWVGFIALFGIATNDGVIMGTYIHQVFEKRHPATPHDVREAVVEAGKKRVRAAMMTTAVAVIALLPILTSTGKGADIMVPMAIPTFGGMIIQVMTVFVVPIFQAMWREGVARKGKRIDESI